MAPRRNSALYGAIYVRRGAAAARADDDADLDLDSRTELRGALLAALNDDGLAAAYLDVLAEEPPRKDSPGAALIAHDRCFVTPHTAWATDQSRRRLVDTACASIAAFLRGDELKYQV